MVSVKILVSDNIHLERWYRLVFGSEFWSDEAMHKQHR